ncbi:MAG: hypothetical protein MUP30_04225 [Deltaproteobacteria bacterium]|nr:hypothetical protein [Deltaproteobacteria bacterium]
MIRKNNPINRVVCEFIAVLLTLLIMSIGLVNANAENSGSNKKQEQAPDENTFIKSLFAETRNAIPLKFIDINQYERQARQILLIYMNDGEMPAPSKKYFIDMSSADVNADGEKEIFAQIYHDGEWCGSHGCTLLILQKKNNKWEPLLNTLEHQNVILLKTKTYGYSDLSFIDSFDKGRLTKKMVEIWRYDGKSYKPYAVEETEHDRETAQDTSTIYKIINYKRIKIE